MNIEKAEQLLRLYEEGYDIYWETNYLDGTLHIWKDEDGIIKFRSQVWAERDLTGIGIMLIEVKKEIDNWEEL